MTQIQTESQRDRRAAKERMTKETTIEASLEIDGTGTVDVRTGLPFFDHMVEQLGRHASFDLVVHAQGDLHVDAHHTVEDVGIVLGGCLAEALGDKRGIRRFASMLLPLDEALIEVALDLSGRPFLAYDVEFAPGRGRARLAAVRPPAGRGVLARLRHGRQPHTAHPPPGGQEHPPHARGRVQGRGAVPA